MSVHLGPGATLLAAEPSPERGRYDAPEPNEHDLSRIKLGTESSGGFRNIAISNCVFDRSRGLALETVDGGDVEDVTVTNLTMRDVTTAPLFLRIGNRGRTPGDPPPGRMRRITISNVVASGVDPRYPALIAGLAGHPVEDVDLSHIRIVYRGGGTREDAAREPPENETAYPEPSTRGRLASGVPFALLRDVRGLSGHDSPGLPETRRERVEEEDLTP